MLPLPDLLEAWRAKRVGYRRGAYTLRARFRQERHVSRREAIERTLPLARANVRMTPGGPEQYGGSHALARLAAGPRGEVSAGLERNLLGFSLPTAARRAVDAAGFLAEGGQQDAAEVMNRQAMLWGQAVSAAARQCWEDTAQILDELADAERSLATTL
jgi:hypothetical protein